MKARIRAGIVSAICALLAGCAAPGGAPLMAATAAPERANISARDARESIVIGTSSKAEVIAALGKTQVVSFDSGYEVWVYRSLDDAPPKGDSAERAALAKEASSKAEFVVLFAPSGVGPKTRIRPAPRPIRSAIR